jgi:outer membrane lipoprotein SlyB
MKTPRIIVALLLAAILTGCVSTAPRAGGDAASRSNGNQSQDKRDAVTFNGDVTIYGNVSGPLASIGGQAATSTDASQAAEKTNDIGKIAANAAVTGQGTAKAEGEPSVTTPPAPATDPAPPASEPGAPVAPAPQPVEPATP